MAILSLLKFTNGPWEKVRGYLRADLETIQTAINRRWAQTFGTGNVLPAAAGGTGLTTFTTGDLLTANTDISLTTLHDVAIGNALLSEGIGNIPAWGKIGLTTTVTGILPVTNGGTGTATAFTANSVVYAGASGVYSQDNANFSWTEGTTTLALGNALTVGVSLVVGTTSLSAATLPVLIKKSTAAVGTGPTVRLNAYSPSYECLNKDDSQNWYFGIQDDAPDTKYLYIGAGYGPNQGLTPAIKVQPNSAVTIPGTLAIGTALAATSGGTGQASYSTGDILYASSSTALSRLTAVAAGSVLTSTGLGSAPAWGQSFNTNPGVTSTGALNNYNPGFAGCVFITFTGADPAWTGFSGGVAGAILVLKNTGTGVGTFAHNSGSSSSGNKLFNALTSAPTPVGPRGWIVYQYDGTQWQLIDHNQGGAIAFTPTDASGASLAFSVAVGSYIVDGLFIKIDIQVNYPVTASAASAIIGSLPFTCGGLSGGMSVGYIASGTAFTTYALVNATATTVSLTTNQSVAITNTQMSNGGIIFSGTYAST